jgi:trimeric autotransporter adhesin
MKTTSHLKLTMVPWVTGSIRCPPLRRVFLFVPLLLACLALLPIAQAVVPPPDGGYANENTAEGTQALFSLTTGSDNTATGFQALYSNTEGVKNVAIGAKALLFNTTGNGNTANGRAALQSNTTGDFNTATGHFALFSNTTGSENLAYGSGALFSNTTGYANTAYGGDALFSNIDGSDNTAIGFQALYSNTSGGAGDNTAVGFQALYSNTSGGGNNAFGDGALFSNISGTRNVAVGGGALNNLTSGDSNVAVGNVTLLQAGTVNFNTALGRRALHRCQGDQNVGLGFFAGANLNDGGTNNIYVGNVGPVPIGSESNTIRIGTQTATTATAGTDTHLMPAHTATYIAGIAGTALIGRPVMINANGRLGAAPSSARFKEEIKQMDKASETILALKPVTFRYKKEVDAERTPQFGLVAEQVETVNPDLVTRDPDGKAFTVRYEAVNAMLLNEFLKEHRQVQEQQKEIDALKAELREQKTLIQKVSARVELQMPPSQTVANGK